ncbi:hypothetical protein P7K49_010203 [Saguinus oedipus]|uniref:Uncharacterized protein n=1 Tax=Saguinus oedipus TaxID=9490 RepID=A0ABQ9VMM2_SAGOE|nr:hypothetical protein P7K49_010203 [Saguinus oedipus]
MPVANLSRPNSRLMLALSLGPGPPLQGSSSAQIAYHGVSRASSCLPAACPGPKLLLQAQPPQAWLLPAPGPSGPSICLSVDPLNLTVASAQPSSCLCGSLSPQSQSPALPWSPQAKPVPPGGPPVPSVGLLASSPCPECLQVSLSGPSSSSRRLLRSNLPASPGSQLPEAFVGPKARALDSGSPGLPSSCLTLASPGSASAHPGHL